MKKIPFILFSLVLGVVILAGCGKWLAKRKAERDDAKKQAEAAKQDGNKTNAKQIACNDTLTLADIAYSWPADKPYPADSLGIWMLVDTTKRPILPNFNAKNLFDCYAYLFEPYFDLSHSKIIVEEERGVGKQKNYSIQQFYKGYSFGSPMGGVHEVNGIIRLLSIRIIDLHKDPEVNFTEAAALAKALEADFTYVSHAEWQWQQRMLKELGYIPTDKSPYKYNHVTGKRRFYWQKPEGYAGSYEADSIKSYPKGEPIWIKHPKSNEWLLCWHFSILALEGAGTQFETYIDAKTGDLVKNMPLAFD